MNHFRILEFLKRAGARNVKSRGSFVYVECPLSHRHSKGTDKNPSAWIAENQAGYSSAGCWSCGWRGGFIDFLSIMDIGYVSEFRNPYQSKLAFEAYQAECRHPSSSFRGTTKPNPARAKKIAMEPLPKPIERSALDEYEPITSNDNAMRYYLDRGGSLEVADSLDLRWNPVQHRIMFPVFDQANNLFGFHGRTIFKRIEPKTRDYKNLPKSKLLLGANLIRRGTALVLVEGAFDLVKVLTLGHQNHSFASILGSNLSKHQVSLIRGWIDSGLILNSVVLLLDNDKAGASAIFGDGAREGILSRLERAGIEGFAPAWPDHVYDPAELSRNQLWEMLA